MDFKKLRKSSSKKLIKGGLGFFLSPREDARENGQSSSASHKDAPFMTNVKKSNDWGTSGLRIENSNEVEETEKDYIDDIPVIPSIDDFADDDLTTQIAKAPLIGVKQIATYKELENDMLKHSAFSSFEEVNLQVFIKVLHPESSLQEPDIPWTKESLFTDLVSKINERKVSH
ncbi:hypothetical protein RUM43_009814 [Polyplax serrata]|uniref:Uncharacterized protein n=1 Tax=Polyplax serrata TaxID=468196 RepID=A0AAN8RZX0_POLSC